MLNHYAPLLETEVVICTLQYIEKDRINKDIFIITKEEMKEYFPHLRDKEWLNNKTRLNIYSEYMGSYCNVYSLFKICSIYC
jgi:hypothetical protein